MSSSHGIGKISIATQGNNISTLIIWRTDQTSIVLLLLFADIYSFVDHRQNPLISSFSSICTTSRDKICFLVFFPHRLCRLVRMQAMMTYPSWRKRKERKGKELYLSV